MTANCPAIKGGCVSDSCRRRPGTKFCEHYACRAAPRASEVDEIPPFRGKTMKTRPARRETTYPNCPC